MATGGHHNDGKELRQKIEPSNNGSNVGDRTIGTPWNSLPNNLELNAKSKRIKKQGNREKSRSSAGNLASSRLPCGNSTNKFHDLCFPSSSNDHPSPPKRNIKVPLNKRSPVFQGFPLNSTMENGNAVPSKDEYVKKPETTAIKQRLEHLQDCIAQVNSVLHHLKQSDEPTYKAEVPRLENMRNMLSEDEQVHTELLRQQIRKEASVPSYEDDDDDSDSNTSSLPRDVNELRDLNGIVTTLSEEDKANLQNHLIEKMKTSQEKLSALKQQQSFLISMQKNAEERLAAFQAELANTHASEQAQANREWQYAAEAEAARADDCFPNIDSGWKADENAAANSHSGQNMKKTVKNGPKTFFSEGGEENGPGINVLHANLESIKRRLEVLQECADNRNVDVMSPNDPGDGENLSERLVAVQWQRKKLKNRLLELQEKKKASDDLMKELSLIKDAATAVEHLNGEPQFFPSLPDTDLDLNQNTDSVALEAMRETISQLRGMLGTRTAAAHEAEPANFPSSSAQEDPLSKQNSFRASPGKRDNIKKGQKEQFPVRRHYEAEGRANEDPDVPATLVPVVSPSPEVNTEDIARRKNKRRLQVARMKKQLVETVLDSVNGDVEYIPESLLHAISTFSDGAMSGDESETVTDNEDSQENDDSDSVAGGPLPEVGATAIKEEAGDMMHQESNRAEAAANIEELQNLEDLKNERDRLLKLHQKFSRLREKFSSSSKQNNEETRSSGEGGNLQKKRAHASHQVSVSNHLPPPSPLRQDNLLTRQNVATVESQNRNNSSNITRNSNTALKKDNINDLSAKFNKPSGHLANRSGADMMFKYRSDGKSFREVAQTANKPRYTDIVKQDRNKLQNYSRNHDVPVRSNSSINSEPLDESNSAIAQDTTVAATWGGSSTQENFEDENEAFGSMGDPEEDESRNCEAMGISHVADMSLNENVVEGEPLPLIPSKPFQFAERYPNYSTDSSTKRRDNRLHKYFKSTQLNQWTSRKKNFTQPSSQRSQNSSDNAREFPPADDAQGQADVASQTSAGSLNSAQPMPDKFMQRLSKQLEQLNALCRPVLQENPTTPTVPCQPVPPLSRESSGLLNFQYPVPNTCRTPVTGVPDVVQSYTQQLQFQQQLLLTLSQCYHALYIQQLEILHLHRCMQQGPDVDTPSQQASTAEDFTFRPCYLSPWLNPAVTSVPFPPGQTSPMSAPPFVQSGQQPFVFNPTPSSATPAPCALVTSVPPARAVVHPAAQDTRASSETLNNQVPPRTRANNFWDNFRSYSRQNLLSANTVKSKDSTCSTGGPQVRQVHPLVPNESSWGQRSKVSVPPHTESASTATSVDAPPAADSQPLVRPVSNPEYQSTMSKSKKPNFTRPHGASQPLCDSASTSATTNFAACPETDQACPSFVDENPFPERNRKIKAVGATAAATPLTFSSHPLPDNIHSEVSTLLAQSNGQEGCLEELIRELRNLKVDSLPRALSAVRELASHESAASTLPPVRHFEGDGHSGQMAGMERPSQPLDGRHDGPTTTTLSSSAGGDMNAFKVSCESTCQRNNQNWPPATIIPLGKHIHKPSTGAVKKRPSTSRDPLPGATSSPWVLSAVAESQTPEQEKMPSTPSRTDCLQDAIEWVIFDMIPFFRSHMMDDCCGSTRNFFIAKVIEALRSHLTVKLSSDFLFQLHQTLMQVANKYATSKWGECESTVVKNVAAALLREVAIYKSMVIRLSLEEGPEQPSAKNSQPDVLPSTSSAKAFDMNTQVIPSKDHFDPIDSESNNSYPVQEFDNATGELYVLNMSPEDIDIPIHCNGNTQHELVRGAIGGCCLSPIGSWQAHLHTIKAEEDTAYECDPEAEIEPEVEIGTEADLAEADQSPGQQVTSNGMVVGDVWHVSQPCQVHVPHGASADSAASIEDSSTFSESASAEMAMSLPLSKQGACNNVADKEISLDDIPTKLTALSQEELQRQISEEQEVNMLLAAHQLEGSEDITLVGNGDILKDPPTFI